MILFSLPGRTMLGSGLSLKRFVISIFGPSAFPKTRAPLRSGRRGTDRVRLASAFDPCGWELQSSIAW
jgi:hypothetical protein